MYKDRTDLKLCTHYGVGDHSLEDCPTMLEKINTKKNVNVLSCVQKNDVITTKNIHIVTRQGTKTGLDNPRISNIKDTNIYPDPVKEKETYKQATHVFQDIAWQEDIDNSRPNTINQLIQLVQKDKSVSQFIDLLHEIKGTIMWI